MRSSIRLEADTPFEVSASVSNEVREQVGVHVQLQYLPGSQAAAAAALERTCLELRRQLLGGADRAE
ncbi:hypothetical protein G9U51_08355 [Calidifontibacter sp. DB0510]|uniref:Uncharacterized protein n=1 Tax=Metallococcus carri TaxID=1656884 RepID=A0A967E8Z3_9MICO|nr:hypothetical protein [Metallococcus carri]NHN55787.1 hypothetical protein [Metallococcus carri]NOP38524.1 hypothetical protein [Calidifontibacter sp. DB2511S]